MFRKMRRSRQQLPQEDAIRILEQGSSGVLALHGDDDYPYAVPLSYVYQDGRLYFHCAKSGHKLDAVQKNAKASFCVIAQDEVIPAEYTTFFRSVIAFGKIRIITEEAELRAAIEALAMKYAPQDTAENRDRYIMREWKPLCMFALEIEHMTGKEAIELTRKRTESHASV